MPRYLVLGNRSADDSRNHGSTVDPPEPCHYLLWNYGPQSSRQVASGRTKNRSKAQPIPSTLHPSLRTKDTREAPPQDDPVGHQN